MQHRFRLLAFGIALLIVGSLIFASLPRPVVRAQEQEPPAQNGALGPVVSQAINFAETPALRDIEPSTDPAQSVNLGRAETNTEEEEEDVIEPTLDVKNSPEALAASVQTAAPQASDVTPSSNFEGLSSNDNAAVLGGRVFPPDTDGDVGRTQYVQIVNNLFRIYDKTTGAPLTAPRRTSALFTALPSSSRCRTRDDGDPIVLYDSFADRWFISQFIAVAPFAQCIAVSQTSDATGAYFAYEFAAPNGKFADYPKYGVWPDAYYSTVNQFAQPSNSFASVGAYAYDRAKILRGDPTATYVYFDLATFDPNTSDASFLSGMLPTDADGFIPPPSGAPNVFAAVVADEFGYTLDGLELFNFHADFANPAASTFTERTDSPLAVAPFDSVNPSGRDDIEQPRPAAATAYLDALGSLSLMNRLQYRNFGGFEELTVNHTINVGTRTPGFFPTAAQFKAAPRYYELRRTAVDGNFSVQNQGTFAPDSNERWMGSAALDNQGNFAIGYSVSSLSVFPSIRYTGRLATDPANTLQAEQTLQAGTGVQTNSGSRWGDYSAMRVDPTDDCTFFYTTEYYKTTFRTPVVSPFGINWQTRIGSFKFPQCVAPSSGTLNVTATNGSTGATVQGASVVVDGNLYGTTLSNGTFTTSLAPGDHTVVISAPGFTAPVTQTVSIAANATTTMDSGLAVAAMSKKHDASVSSIIALTLWQQLLRF